MSALFKTIEEIKEYLAINISNDIKSIIPYVKRMEAKFIVRALGRDQYNDLLEWFHEGSGSVSDSGSGSGSENPPLTDQEHQDLLVKVQEPLASLAFLAYIPIGNLQISDSGFSVAETPTKKVASQFRIEDIKKSFRESGHDGLDTLLEFLEENSDTYHLWKNSSAYTVFKQFFIHTSRDFSSLYNINESRLTFMAMSSTMKKVEEFEIRSVISKELYKTIKTEILDDELTADNKILLEEHIKPAVAHLTVARAALDLTVDLTDEGIFINSIEEEKISQKRKAPDPNISALITSANKDGMVYIEIMERFLNDNADKYPEYKDSDIFDDGESSSKNDLDNLPGSGQYVV